MGEFFGGVIAQLMSDAILHPLDNLKCLYQTRSTVSPESFHIRSLYRGYSVVVLAGAPGSGIFYFAYENLKRTLAEDFGVTEGAMMHVAASSAATVASTSVYAPMEVVKETCFVKMCNAPEAMRSIYADAGIAGFFRGWSMSIATWVPYMTSYFMLYEHFKTTRLLCPADDRSQPGADPSFTTWLTDMKHGMLAGAVSAAVTYPLDALKTRIQSGAGAVEPLTGAATLRALMLRIAWLAPGSALTISFYEQYAKLSGPQQDGPGPSY